MFQILPIAERQIAAMIFSTEQAIFGAVGFQLAVGIQVSAETKSEHESREPIPCHRKPFSPFEQMDFFALIFDPDLRHSSVFS